MNEELAHKLWQLPLSELRHLFDVLGDLDQKVLWEYQKLGALRATREWEAKMRERARKRERFYAAKCESLKRSGRE